MNAKCVVIVICLGSISIHSMEPEKEAVAHLHFPDFAHDRLSIETRREYAKVYPDIFIFPTEPVRQEPRPEPAWESEGNPRKKLKMTLATQDRTSLHASTAHIQHEPVNPSAKPQSDVENIKVVFDKEMSDVYEYLEFLIDKEGVDPKKILFVLDLDGTITDSKNPSDSEADFRSGAADLLHFILKIKVNIVISSAWYDPEISEETFRDLDLHHWFGLDPNERLVMNEEVELLGTKVDTYVLGPLCGVREHDKSRRGSGWYNNKYKAPLLACSTQEISSFIHFVFVDDNKTNINNFKEKIGTIGINAEAKVALFHLAPPSEDG